MTVIERNPLQPLQPLQPVVFDLYRDIHKGIRAELFALTQSAGALDASDRAACVDLARHVHTVVDLLVTHAEHEDTAIQPAIEAHLPDLAPGIESDHVALEQRIAAIDELTAAAVDVAGAGGASREDARRIYLELASFTSAYLVHQDHEERVVMPALEHAIGVEAVVEIHEAIIASIPPAELATSLALMLPAMNIDDRSDLLGGMREHAPAEAFAAVWALTGSILGSTDRAAVARRIGIA
jgi:hypothetical protein